MKMPKGFKDYLHSLPKRRTEQLWARLEEADEHDPCEAIMESLNIVEVGEGNNEWKWGG
jgi:hypothetical protein